MAILVHGDVGFCSTHLRAHFDLGEKKPHGFIEIHGMQATQCTGVIDCSREVKHCGGALRVIDPGKLLHELIERDRKEERVLGYVRFREHRFERHVTSTGGKKQEVVFEDRIFRDRHRVRGGIREYAARLVVFCIDAHRAFQRGCE